MLRVNTNLISLIITSVIIILIINLTIPNIILPYIKHKQSHPKEGIENLSFKEKFLHFMYFLAKAPILSSLVLIILCGTSIFLGSIIKIRPSTIKSIQN